LEVASEGDAFSGLDVRVLRRRREHDVARLPERRRRDVRAERLEQGCQIFLDATGKYIKFPLNYQMAVIDFIWP
jgi:hypothetical protein